VLSQRLLTAQPKNGVASLERLPDLFESQSILVDRLSSFYGVPVLGSTCKSNPVWDPNRSGFDPTASPTSPLANSQKALDLITTHMTTMAPMITPLDYPTMLPTTLNNLTRKRSRSMQSTAAQPAQPPAKKQRVPRRGVSFFPRVRVWHYPTEHEHKSTWYSSSDYQRFQQELHQKIMLALVSKQQQGAFAEALAATEMISIKYRKLPVHNKS